MPPFSYWIFGLVFFLLPIASWRPIAELPIYAAEIPIFVLLGIAGLFWSHLLKVLVDFWRREKRIILWGIVFIVGALLTFIVQERQQVSLGEIKSFILLPIVFSVLLAISLAQEDHVKVLKWWWGGLVAIAAASLGSFLVGGMTYDGRLHAFYQSPNQLAMLLAPGTLIGLWLIVTHPFRRCWPYFLATLLISAMIFLTRSYAVIGTLFFVSGLWFSQRSTVRMRSQLLFITAVLLVACTWIVLEWPSNKFQSIINLDERSSLASRLMIWESASKIFIDHFPFGIGMGQFQTVYLAYQVYFPPYLEWAVPEPHNLMLSLLLSVGVLGTLGFLGVALSLFLRLYKREKHTVKSVGMLYSMLLLWLFCIGIVDTSYFTNSLTLVWWGVVGLGLGFLKSTAFAKG